MCVVLLPGRWFDKGEDDGAIERELFPTTGSDGDSVNWKLTVVTGGLRCRSCYKSPCPHTADHPPCTPLSDCL